MKVTVKMAEKMVEKSTKTEKMTKVDKADKTIKVDKAEYNGQKGYVSSDYVTDQEPDTTTQETE